jgi:polyvinyl alcohol dehydrogenase (cytochrome)
MMVEPMNKWLTGATCLLLAGCSSTSDPKHALGEKVYRDRCATCHNSLESHAPLIGALRQMPAARILRAMDFGVMMGVTYALDRTEREAVAQYLGVPDEHRAPQAKAFCADRSVTIAKTEPQDWNGWSPDAANRRFQSSPGITAAQVPSLRLKWVFGFEGDVNAFAPPTVLGRNLFVGSAGGAVYALDVESGCVRWFYQAQGPVRTAMLVEPIGTGERHAVLFGDQIGWFYALEAESGKLLWQKKPEEHESTKLTGSSVARDGVVYIPTASWEESRGLNTSYTCCTFRGSIVALRIADGEQVWKTYAIEETPHATGATMRDGRPEWGPSGAGIWSAPTIDARRGVLYATTGNNYTLSTANSDAVLALDLKTGRLLWSRQVTPDDVFNLICSAGQECPGQDFDFGASAILTRAANGRELLLAGQKSGMVYALDSNRKGEIVWQTRVGKGGINGGVQWGMAADAANVYASVSDVARVRIASKSKFDPRPNPVDPNSGGGLTALRISDGTKVWYAAPPVCEENREACSPAMPAAVTAIPGVVFAGAVDGRLRAYASTDGTVLWEFDTARDWQTVNGVKASGGAIDGPGAVVAGGMVFIQSGYARNGGRAGNILLAFSVPE